MTIAQKICESGVATLAEYLCIPCSGGGNGVIYTEVIELEEKKAEVLEEVFDEVEYLLETETDYIEEYIDKSEILEDKEEIIDGIC